ncbi:carbohydrate ABC transporter permease [Cellulosilyticum sp. I15G10I2]|uniref:carbohydrate ABC transporter permease n=1 Tax=Cellulosilyticum sp. I15G10I2 TaxID=1892843 RepID=UPI00085C824A|nr:carbohydrate ABC transporter permease [Cellulosilyticum sp. I15G10I2]
MNKKKNNIIASVKIVVLSILFISYIGPMGFVLMNSFKSNKDIILNPLGIFGNLNIKNYIDAAEKMKYVSAFGNSLLITVLSVGLIILTASMAAYIFCRKKWAINNFMFYAMIAAMILPFQALMIPLVSIYGGQLNILNKWTLIYMYIGFGAPLAVFMYHGFIKGIPLELEEAAQIDGASSIRVFTSIIWPILRPITLTITILDVLWIWNDFLLPSLILVEAKDRTLPLSTFYFYGTYSVDLGLMMAGLVLTITPVLILYLFLQKYILEGVVQGAIK